MRVAPAVVGLGLTLALALPTSRPTAAAAAEDRQAALATGFDGLRLLDSHDLRRAGALGIQFAHVETDTQLGGGLYSCGALPAGDARPAAATVAAALHHLPDAALARLRLRHVVLCGGVSAGSQSVGGIPVPARDLLMLDAGDESSLSHRTLHELYHLLEYRFGGIDDADWLGRFGGGYSHRYPGLLRKSPLGSGRAGFVSAYGEINPHEDRAELFAYLVLSPRDVADLIRRAGDTVLRRKAEYVGDKCHRLIDLSLGLPGS